MKLTSPAFHQAGTIPFEFTGDGADVSPPLYWSDPPAGTQSFAIICLDPDAPQAEPWVHWLIYNIPSSTMNLSEAIAHTATVSMPAPADQGLNSNGHIGYNGPLPPLGDGWHRYCFELFALDTETLLPGGATKQQLVEAMKGHVLASAVLQGRYQRKTSARRHAI